jgi:hypothetical protein
MDMIEVSWVDRGRDPREKSNPQYPDGIDVDLSKGATRTCKVALPYPALRCGYYALRCGLCGYSAIITTAGRADDPRSAVLPCKSNS